MALTVRSYGDNGPLVVLLHGGPGAAGYLAPLARALAEHRLRVLEPFQRGGATEAPLTVARHVADLEALLAERCQGEPPAVVGHSWGAMLALAHAAAHPRREARVALIGCGSFDAAARAGFEGALAARLAAQAATCNVVWPGCPRWSPIPTHGSPRWAICSSRRTPSIRWWSTSR